MLRRLRYETKGDASTSQRVNDVLRNVAYPLGRLSVATMRRIEDGIRASLELA